MRMAPISSATLHALRCVANGKEWWSIHGRSKQSLLSRGLVRLLPGGKAVVTEEGRQHLPEMRPQPMMSVQLHRVTDPPPPPSQFIASAPSMLAICCDDFDVEVASDVRQHGRAAAHWAWLRIGTCPHCGAVVVSEAE